ncbi:hypothetical protein QFZ76_000287 [Streptomyces sp. V4I2]|nr:hypothetical protein [Streptomyces sp. V4I2]
MREESRAWPGLVAAAWRRHADGVIGGSSVFLTNAPKDGAVRGCYSDGALGTRAEGKPDAAPERGVVPELWQRGGLQANP